MLPVFLLRVTDIGPSLITIAVTDIITFKNLHWEAESLALSKQ